MKKDILLLTDLIIIRLKSAGLRIQRYDSISTNSVYLKFDYGMCHSLRISDHKGKKHLQYRYNLLSTRKGIHHQKTSTGMERSYYGFNSIEKFINDIIIARTEKMLTFGIARYIELMGFNYLQNKRKAGFWSKCKEV